MNCLEIDELDWLTGHDKQTLKHQLHSLTRHNVFWLQHTQVSLSAKLKV
jgi:hypothetical protein